MKQHPTARDSASFEPTTGEHGVSGYTDSAVGGFGASYASQVAHGGEGESASQPSETELDAAEANAGEAVSLDRAVHKSLARAHVDAADLRVEIHGTQVTLFGSVRHVSEKNELEARARSVTGVESVVNHLAALRGEWEE